jgi:hypothetical protein
VPRGDWPRTLEVVTWPTSDEDRLASLAAAQRQRGWRSPAASFEYAAGRYQTVSLEPGTVGYRRKVREREWLDVAAVDAATDRLIRANGAGGGGHKRRLEGEGHNYRQPLGEHETLDFLARGGWHSLKAGATGNAVGRPRSGEWGADAIRRNLQAELGSTPLESAIAALGRGRTSDQQKALRAALATVLATIDAGPRKLNRMALATVLACSHQTIGRLLEEGRAELDRNSPKREEPRYWGFDGWQSTSVDGSSRLPPEARRPYQRSIFGRRNLVETTNQAEGSYTTISTHVPLSLARDIAKLARENERSASGEIRLALRRHRPATRAARARRGVTLDRAPVRRRGPDAPSPKHSHLRRTRSMAHAPHDPQTAQLEERVDAVERDIASAVERLTAVEQPIARSSLARQKDLDYQLMRGVRSCVQIDRAVREYHRRQRENDWPTFEPPASVRDELVGKVRAA